MFDPQRLLGNLLGQALTGSFGGSRGRSVFAAGDLGTKATLGLGALGIALAAFEHFGQSTSASTSVSSPPPPPLTSPPPPPGRMTAAPPPPPAAAGTALATHTGNEEAILLIRTMIAAAAADGVIDASEQAMILARAAASDAAAEAFLRAELAAPRSADEIGADTPPALVEPVYAAAWLTIDAEQPGERAFLDRLCAALGLNTESRQAIEYRAATAAARPTS